MTAKGTGRTPLYGTSTGSRTVQGQGYDNIPVQYGLYPYTVPTGYHLTVSEVLYWLAGRRSTRLLSLALRKYTRALVLDHRSRILISVAESPGLSRTKPASWHCAGFVNIICLIRSLLSFRNTIDWRSPLFPRLQAQHAVTRLSRSSVPPSASATLWSTSRRTFGAACPQYWQVKLSRARISQRSLYHPFKSIRFGISILYSTGGATASVAAYPCTV